MSGAVLALPYSHPIFLFHGHVREFIRGSGASCASSAILGRHGGVSVSSRDVDSLVSMVQKAASKETSAFIPFCDVIELRFGGMSFSSNLIG